MFVAQLYDVIKNYFYRTSSKGVKAPLVLIIKGDIGSGKTHAARSLVEKLQKD
jgi:tRNA A37 threonylcarbamoyladenosine biosynthesis protein TsaE